MVSQPLTSTATPKGVARIQSPSSINLWRQCPRKYYYRYIGNLPSLPSIHLVRGTIVHDALDKFFNTDVTRVPETVDGFFMTMKVVLNEVFKRSWNAHQAELEKLGLTREELQGYYDETGRMIGNYFDYFTSKIKYFTRFLPVKEAWTAVTPAREVEFLSREHHVRGYMDAIHDEAGKTIILDYKTSRKAEITEEYEVQLSIYAMLYQEKFRTPDLVGIFFLKDGVERLLEVTPAMVEKAKRDVQEVHLGTKTRDVRDYPKKPGPLCKWSTGQCDYYEYCYLGKELPASGGTNTGNNGRPQRPEPAPPPHAVAEAMEEL